MMADQPVSPPHPNCCTGLFDQCGSQELACGLCCAGLAEEEDAAKDEDAVLDDAVIGKSIGDEKENVSVRALPAPKGWSAAEWLRHCISHIPYDNRCPFL